MKHSKSFTNILLVALAVLLMAGCGGAESRKAKYLERSKNYLEQQNYDKAAVELKNVLQIDPKYAEAYYLLGQIEEGKGSWQKAFGGYLKAVELDSDHFSAQASLGRFYLLSGDIAKAEEIEQKILAKSPDHAEGRTLKAAILVAKKDVLNAIKLLREVVAADPTHVSTIVFLADIYLRQKQPEKAQELLEKTVVDNPKNGRLRIELSKLYFQLKDNVKAEEQLKALVELDSKNLPYQASLVAFYIQTRQLDKAENLIKELIKADPKEAQRHLLLTEFLVRERSTEQAEKQLLSSIDEYPKMYELRFALASLYGQVNKPDLSEQQYRKIIDGAGTEPVGLRARTMLAGLLLNQGKSVDEYERIIEEVLKINPRDNDALLLRGKILLGNGKPQDAVVAFRSILKDAPRSVEVLTLLGSAHLLSGEKELAKENLLKAVELDPKDSNAQLMLARFYARTGNYKDALRKIDEILETSPKNIDALETRIEIFNAKQDQKGLQASILKLKENYPEDARGYYLLGQFYLAQKKFDAAIHEYNTALKKSKTNPLQPLVGIVKAHVGQGKPELAISRLAGLTKETPNHPYAHELLAQLYFSRKQYPEAEKESREAIKANPGWNVPYMSLANLYSSRNDLLAAEETIQQGLRAIPEDAELLFYAAQFYEKTRNLENAVAMYERILQKYRNSDIAANNLASLLTDQLGDAESLKKARMLAERFASSPQPVFRDTLGWVYFKTGETDKAVSILKDVVKQAPNVSIFRYHLGMAYHKQGNLTDAKAQLAKALEGKNDFAGKDEARAVFQKIP
jgi:tetratricopeptide (TPR) repeat protein